MRIYHPAVTSSVFEMAKVVELDVQLDDDAYTMRIELMRDTENQHHFRCHVWGFERFPLTPIFSTDGNDRPSDISDDVLTVDRRVVSRRVKFPREDIVAPDTDSALEIVIDDFERFLEHVTLEKAEWKQQGL